MTHLYPFRYSRFFGPDDPGGGGGKSKIELDLEDAKKQADLKDKELKEAREAREKAEKELADKKKIEDQVKKTADEEALKAKGDYEGLKKMYETERNQLETERGKILIEAEIQKLATKHALKKESYLALLDRSGIAVKDGKVTGSQEAFDAFKKEHPDLFGAAASSGSDNRPERREGGSSFVDEMVKKTEARRPKRWPRGWQ
jgi:hypothetical protein